MLVEVPVTPRGREEGKKVTPRECGAREASGASVGGY